MLAHLKILSRRTFGEGTAWQEALARRKEAYTPAKRREKRFAHLYHLLSEFVQIAEILQKHIFPGASVEIYCKSMFFREPVEGPWLHGAVIHLLDKGEAEVLFKINPSTANY